jgi:hypothetical protein
MNSKGQIAIGGIIIAFVAIVIGLAFFNGTFAQSIGTMTKTNSLTNTSFTMPDTGVTSELSICGQKVISIALNNATNGTYSAVPSNNYTTSQRASTTDGYLVSTLTTTVSVYSNQTVNVTCDYQPRGYISDSGSRGIVSLIAVFMALLIMIAAMPNLRNGVMDFVKGK